MSYKITFPCLKFTSLALFLLIFQLGQAQGSRRNNKEFGVERFADFDALLTRHQKSFGNDAIALIWTDTVVYKKVLGEFNDRTVVPIGSASKWLTAALLLQFVDEGRLSLDDKIADYLPVYASYGKNYITLRHCLTHFTGIQAEGKLFSKKKFATLDEFVSEYAKHEIQTNPGTEARYNDLGASIAGRVLEVVSKKKFEMLIKQKLLNPLGMRQSTFATLDGSAPDPSEGGKASATDLLHFLQMLLQKGMFNGQRILSEASVMELRKISSSAEQIKDAPKTTFGYGYALAGWALEEKDGVAQSLINPGLPGVWPVVDWCRGYAALILPKTSSGEQKKEMHLQFKDAIDEQVKGKCE